MNTSPLIQWCQYYPDTKSDKVITRKKRLMSFMRVDAKILNNILANWIQQHTERMMHYVQLEFISGMWGWFNIWKSTNVMYCVNRIKNKKHMIISIDREKTLDKSTLHIFGAQYIFVEWMRPNYSTSQCLLYHFVSSEFHSSVFPQQYRAWSPSIK